MRSTRGSPRASNWIRYIIRAHFRTYASNSSFILCWATEPIEIFLNQAWTANSPKMPYPLPTRSAALEPPRSVMPRSNAQQSWARQRYSSFFHGESVVASTPSTFNRTSPRKSSKTSRCSFRARIEESNPTLRSPTSIRSLIDPVSPPLTTYSPITSDEFAQFQRRDHPNPPPLAHTRPRRTSGDLRRAERHLERAIDRSRRRQGRRRTNTVNKAGKTRKRKCFPAVRNPKIRRKIFGSLISAMILSILLIICTLPHFPFPPPSPPQNSKISKALQHTFLTP